MTEKAVEEVKGHDVDVPDVKLQEILEVSSTPAEERKLVWKLDLM